MYQRSSQRIGAIIPSLADQFKSLGVNLGTGNLSQKPDALRKDFPIEKVIAGEWQATQRGEAFVVEKRYPDSFRQGCVPLRGNSPSEIIAAWAKAPQLSQLDLEQFLFLDTETTGLYGGTGIYTFLIGAGRFEGDQFRMVQFFLRDPAEESAQLAAFEQFAAPCEAIVSFNGKSFDMPMLNNRFILNGWPQPFKGAGHLDLLHLARRLWRDRLPSRTLGDLEAKILGLRRSEQDVPGWMIGDLYYDYLHTGDARPLQGVFYHNEIDVVSMAALLNHMSALLTDPLDGTIEHGLDLIAIGKLYANLGHLDIAAEIYRRGLNYDDLHKDAYWKALEQLSFLHKKQTNLDDAQSLWQQAAQAGHIYAHVELAKIYEHQNKDYPEAIRWTQAAIEIISDPKHPAIERAQWLPELAHQLKRLKKRQDVGTS